MQWTGLDMLHYSFSFCHISDIPAWFTFSLCFLHLPPAPNFPSFTPSSGLSLGWNHTCASHTSRHTGETYAGWNMVRELCWISLAKRVVINRMTFGNNYQPSSLHPSFPPSFSSHTHPSLSPSPSPSHSVVPSRWGQRERKEKRRERNELRIDGEAGPCCCCLRLRGDLNFEIRLICWKWDWPTAFPQVGRQAGRSAQYQEPCGIPCDTWANGIRICCAGWGHHNAVSSAGVQTNCHHVCTHVYTHAVQSAHTYTGQTRFCLWAH